MSWCQIMSGKWMQMKHFFCHLHLNCLNPLEQPIRNWTPKHTYLTIPIFLSHTIPTPKFIHLKQKWGTCFLPTLHFGSQQKISTHKAPRCCQLLLALGQGRLGAFLESTSLPLKLTASLAPEKIGKRDPKGSRRKSMTGPKEIVFCWQIAFQF